MKFPEQVLRLDLPTLITPKADQDAFVIDTAPIRRLEPDRHAMCEDAFIGGPFRAVCHSSNHLDLIIRSPRPKKTVFYRIADFVVRDRRLF